MDFNGERRRIPLIEEPRRPPWKLIVLLAGGVALLVALWMALDIRLELRPAEEPAPSPGEERAIAREAQDIVQPPEAAKREVIEPVSPPPPTGTAPKWAQLPSVDFPRAGMRAPGGEGRVVLSCVVGAGGSLDACRIVSETPEGYGFGRSAVAGAQKARLSSEARAGATIQFTVRFTPPLD